MCSGSFRKRPTPPGGHCFSLTATQCLLSADRLVLVPWVTHTFLFVAPLNFDANLSTKEMRNRWEKCMEMIILRELAVRGERRQPPAPFSQGSAGVCVLSVQ